MASISSTSRLCFASLTFVAYTLLALPILAADRQVHLHQTPSDLLIHVEGDDDEDWYIQSSADLTNWLTLQSFGTLLSNPTNAPVRSVGALTDAPLFYRALRTHGLYDTNLLRTIDLTFTNSDWQQLLVAGRFNGSNTPALLGLANGASIADVGARYKGNSSFVGTKRSVNLEIDFRQPGARLMGYKTVNLNNAAGDETVMREVLYFNMMRQYVPCPEGAMANLVINNTNWGVYALISQENNDLIDQYFRSNNGDRWRTPNIPNPGPQSAFGYLGTFPHEYLRYYDLRSNNSTNAWNRLVGAITNLHQIPAAEFREKIENYFAVDSWLWFLAIENMFADEDSYWSKGADFSFYYEIESGRIHPVQHDGNEAFFAPDTSLSPVLGATSSRPLLWKFLLRSELRQRYLRS